MAVLGSGVDVVYPPENRRLAREVAEAGAVVSQFPMGTPPLPHHFPARNRVIAGLTLGTVVVEAAERSGALITARLAGELGREVYAVPGNVSSAGSQGDERPDPGRRQARPGLGGRGGRVAPGVAAGPPAPGRARAVDGGEPEGRRAGERAILALLGDDPVAMDAWWSGAGCRRARSSAGLTALELRGLVRRLAGQRYVRS